VKGGRGKEGRGKANLPDPLVVGRINSIYFDIGADRPHLPSSTVWQSKGGEKRGEKRGGEKGGREAKEPAVEVHPLAGFIADLHKLSRWPAT